MKTAGLGLLAALLLPGAARADLQLKGVEWQLAAARGRPKPSALAAWDQKAGAKDPGKLRFAVRVENSGRDRAEGVVIRFALSARIAPISGGESVWAVPFELGERRVPVLKPGEAKELPMPAVHLVSYLRRLQAQGFWPEELKVQVMIDPKTGDNVATNVRESVLPVAR